MRSRLRQDKYTTLVTDENLKSVKDEVTLYLTEGAATLCNKQSLSA